MKIPFGVNPDDTFFQYVPSPILRGLLQSKPVHDLLDWLDAVEFDAVQFFEDRISGYTTARLFT
jgi:hypothetical protein